MAQVTLSSHNSGGYRHTAPIWTADAARVLYSVNRVSPKGRLNSVESAGVTPDGALRAHPNWGSPLSVSPDGRTVVSITWRSELIYGDSLRAHALDGSGSQWLGQLWRGAGVSWAPDSSALAREDGGDIYVVTPDGQSRERLTLEGGSSPAWQPFPREPVAPFPTLKVVSLADGEELPADASSHRLAIRMENYSGPWQWRLDSRFPDHGPGGGVTVSSGVSATVTGLRPGRRHAIYVAPVTPAGELLQPAFVAVRRLRVAFPEPSAELADTYIAFEGTDGLFAVRPDGSDLRRLTTTDGYRDSRPTWSPDGASIAFASDRAGQKDIYILSPDAEEPLQVTTHPSDDFDPAWSPDGSRIAFTSTRDGHDEVYLVAVSDHAVARLTHTEDGAEEAEWSPDGASIVVSYGPTGWHRAYLGLVDPSTGVITDLGAVGDVGRPVWNPLGAPILYARDLFYPGSLAFAINPDGTEQTSLGRALPPVFLDWSPDGAMVAYHDRDGITLARANGDQKTPVEGVVAVYGTPAWSPMGAEPPDGRDPVAGVGDPADLAEGVTLPAGLSALTLSSTLTDLAVDGRSVSARPGSVAAGDLIRGGATLCLRLSDAEPTGVVGEGGRVVAGEDFALVGPAEYVVNFPRSVTLAATGGALHAPSGGGASETGASEPWAFVVLPRVATGSHTPSDARARFVSSASGVEAFAAVEANSRVTPLIGARTDPVVGLGSAIRVELVTAGGYRLGNVTTYRVTADDLHRAFAVVDIPTRPAGTRLLPNYPNPFNPETWLPFELGDASDASITVYDARGSAIRTLRLGGRLPGFHVGRSDAAYWDGRNDAGERMSSGVYYYELRAGDARSVRRMVVGR